MTVAAVQRRAGVTRQETGATNVTACSAKVAAIAATGHNALQFVPAHHIFNAFET
jgi:hypothetical protein